MPTQPRVRRSQEERTAETREALIDAAISAIHKVGYAAASTALIADMAGVSRGAILHQFGTRAGLMAQVVAQVYRREAEIYVDLLKEGEFGHRIYDWPKILLDVLGRPSGVAVLEILQASQSDSELSSIVRESQANVEAAALDTLRQDLGGEVSSALAVMRLMVWSVRGLSIANRVMPGGIDTAAPIALLSALIEKAAPHGRVTELEALMTSKAP